MSFLRPIALALLTAAVVAGCGGGGSHPAASTAAKSATTTAAGSATTGAAESATKTDSAASSGDDESAATGPAPVTLPGASSPAAFAWLHPGPVPPGWSVARLPDRAVLAYPSSWQRIHADPQTVSAARSDARTGLIEEYLNATPQQGGETLQNWSTFRPGHNGEEGDSHIQVIAAARGLRFRDGQGSCVIDRYRTSRTTYQEIACLVRGPRGGNVIVSAAQAGRWAEDAPALERAVSAFVA
jgi:hypothetical protein